MITEINMGIGMGDWYVDVTVPSWLLPCTITLGTPLSNNSGFLIASIKAGTLSVDKLVEIKRKTK